MCVFSSVSVCRAVCVRGNVLESVCVCVTAVRSIKVTLDSDMGPLVLMVNRGSTWAVGAVQLLLVALHWFIKVSF